MRKVLITGITGQDGSYLAEQLLADGYKVYGLTRRTSQPNTHNLSKILSHKNLQLIEGDITDYGCIHRIVHDIYPHEIYNLAAMSFVKASFDEPSHTWDVDAKGAMNILEAVRATAGMTIKVYQASTSEMFGSMYSIIDKEGKRFNFSLKQRDGYVINAIQDEKTPFSPCSPYAIAKLAAHNLINVYRESYGIHAVSGILFNHESERRGQEFVTRKITKWVALAKCNSIDKIPILNLGNPDASRDWGYAPDYMRAARLMINAINPEDYVIATGTSNTVRDFLLEALKVADLPLDFEQKYVKWQTSSNIRPYEVNYLKGVANKAKVELDWKPTIEFKELVKIMVLNDIDLLKTRT